MDAIILLFIILLGLLYVFLNKSSPGLSEPVVQNTPIQQVIEDSEHLKLDLGRKELELRNAHLEIGTLQSQFKIMKNNFTLLTAEKIALQQSYEKLQHQKKSSEVRTGFLGEVMLPLMEQFPVDPKTMRFLGSPIDYISFDYDLDEITFVEVKTGDSQLNEHQRKIKKMVENGKVKFVTVRLNEKGLKVK